MEGKLIKTVTDNYILVDATKEFHGEGYLLGTTTVSDAPRLSLKNCEAIERGYDLDELVNLESPKNSTTGNISEKIGFIRGFQKALEVNADKRFTLKEMVECWNRALEFQTHKETLGEHIKSLRQTEWEVEVVMQKIKDETKIIGSVKGVKGSGSKITTYKSVPKLDPDGCLILRRMSPDSSN